MDIVFHIFIMVGIYAILALSLNLLIGYAGLFSVGHGAFYGIGAYAGALLATRLGLPFWVEMAAAGAIAGAIGYAIGRPILRLRDDNLALATFGLAVITFSVLNNWDDLTNGPLGIRGISSVSTCSTTARATLPSSNENGSPPTVKIWFGRIERSTAPAT